MLKFTGKKYLHCSQATLEMIKRSEIRFKMEQSTRDSASLKPPKRC